MSPLYVVIFIITLNIGSGLSNFCNVCHITEKCLIFKHGLNITWPITDIVKSVSSGYIFNATCGCTTGVPYWDVFINGSKIELSDVGNVKFDITHKTDTYRSCNISRTITESSLLLCRNDCHQYSRPVFINVAQEGPKNSVLSSFPTPSPSLVPTCPLLSSTSLLSSSLFSGSPSHFIPQSFPSQFVSLSSPSPSKTSDVITSLTTTIISSHSNSIITITTVFSTVIVTTTPTCTINTEATTTTLNNISLSTNPFIISTDQQTTVANKCTPTLLAVTIPFGGTVILIVVFVTAIIFCIVVKKYPCTKKQEDNCASKQ